MMNTIVMVMEAGLQSHFKRGRVILRLTHTGKSIQWEATVSRQSSLSEFFPEMLPNMQDQPLGEAEVVIHLSRLLLKTPIQLLDAYDEMLEYVIELNDKEASTWPS